MTTPLGREPKTQDEPVFDATMHVGIRAASEVMTSHLTSRDGESSNTERTHGTSSKRSGGRRICVSTLE